MSETAPNRAPRTLVVHTGGIGDLLLTCPALLRLAGRGPVEFLGTYDRVALLVAGGIGDAAYDLDAVQFHTLFSEPSERLRQFIALFDAVVLWMKDPGQLCQALRACGVNEVKAFPGIPPDTWTEHASCYYLRCLGFADAPPLRLAIEPEAATRDVIIHPGSGGGKKNWALPNFLAVAKALEARGRRVTWCLGPAEELLAAPPNSPVLRAASLIGLAKELAGARLYVGNDSGVTHLAAAVGCPTVAIFGPSDPRVWAPQGDHVTVVCGNPWPDVDAVLGAIE